MFTGEPKSILCVEPDPRTQAEVFHLLDRDAGYIVHAYESLDSLYLDLDRSIRAQSKEVPIDSMEAQSPSSFVPEAFQQPVGALLISLDALGAHFEEGLNELRNLLKKALLQNVPILLMGYPTISLLLLQKLQGRVEDLFFKPLEKEVVLPKMAFFAHGSTDPLKFNLPRSGDMNVLIARTIQISGVSEIGVQVENPKPLKVGTTGHFFLSKEFRKGLIPLLGRCVAASEMPSPSGSHSAFFSFQGLTQKQHLEIRRVMTDVSQYAGKSKVRVTAERWLMDKPLSNEFLEKNFVYIDLDADAAGRFRQTMKDHFKNAHVTTFQSLHEFEQILEPNEERERIGSHALLENLEQYQRYDRNREFFSQYRREGRLIFTLSPDGKILKIGSEPSVIEFAFLRPFQVHRQNHFSDIVCESERPVLNEMFAFIHEHGRAMLYLSVPTIESTVKSYLCKAKKINGISLNQYEIEISLEIQDVKIETPRLPGFVDAVFVDHSMIRGDVADWAAQFSQRLLDHGIKNSHGHRPSLILMKAEEAHTPDREGQRGLEMESYMGEAILHVQSRPANMFLLGKFLAAYFNLRPVETSDIWPLMLPMDQAVHIARKAVISEVSDFGIRLKLPAPLSQGVTLFLYHQEFLNREGDPVIIRSIESGSKADEQGFYDVTFLFFGQRLEFLRQMRELKNRWGISPLRRHA